MKKLLIFVLSLVIMILILFNNDYIKINIMTRLTVQRGLLSPNCFWYKISEMFFNDGSGINIYNKLKKNYGDFAKVNVFNTDFYLVTNLNYIKLILDNSPDLFNVGVLKKNFFSTFMSKNVGVSSGCPWKYRREINEYSLDTNKIHRYSNIYNNFINKQTLFSNKINFKILAIISKNIMSKIIFNCDPKYLHKDVINLFSEANNINALYNKHKINSTILNNYKNTLYYYINNPKKNSLIELCLQKSDNKEEIYNQIPHFIFPISGLFLTTIPRLLCLLCNHLQIFQNVILEIKNNDIYNLKYLRKCILETLRLNNPVISMFRTVEKDIFFDSKNNFKKGTQFLILINPILRSKEFFENCNQFIPERWNSEKEESYYSISFSQGPQKCPGKELAIFLAQSFVYNLIKNNNIKITNFKCNKKLNKNNISQVINPCDIVFTIDNY